MSSDDFQTKYSSVMESMLKAAIAETTKLFETMVDDLKAEISKMKTENEDLKRRCSQFEKATSQTTNTRERESVPEQRDGSDKRDTAVQCDLVPLHMVLVEQCEPLRPSSMQNQEQQCGNVVMRHVWQEHNYEYREKRDSLIASLPEKQLEVCGDFPQQFDIKQKEVDPVASFRKNTGSPLVSACVTENGGSVNKECPTAEISSPQSNEETGVSLKLPHLGRVASLAEVHNQSSEQEPPQHISPTPTKKAEELKNVVAEEVASLQPDLPVRRKRGRPPKKAKHLQQSVKQILPPSSEQEKEMKKRCMDDGAVKAPSTEVSSSIKTQTAPTAKSPQAPSVQSRRRCSSVTLQDAMLLVEAMNQSAEEKAFDSPQTMAANQTKTLQTVDEAPAEPGTQPVDLQTTSTAKALDHKKVVIVKQQHVVSRANAPKINQQIRIEQPNLTPSDKPPVSLPVDTPQLTPPPADLQSRCLLQPKITIVIPRQSSAMALRKQSQNMALTSKQESPQLMAVPQDLSMSGVRHTVPDMDSSTKQTNTSDNLESSKQTASISDATNEPSETPSTLAKSLVLPCPLEQKLSPVVRLNRLPFPVATEKPLLLSRNPRDKSVETKSVFEEGATEETPLSTQPSEIQVSSSDISSNSEEISVSPKTSGEEIQRELPLHSGRAPGLDESSTSSRSTEPLFDKTPEQTTSMLQKQIKSMVVQDCTSPSDPATGQQSPAVISLKSIKSKDPSDPHLLMTKTQFLAQLAVSPILQDPKQPPTNESVDTNSTWPTTRTIDKQLQKNVLVSKLRHHLRTHVEAINSKTSQDSCTQTETLTGSFNEPTLKMDSSDDMSTTFEPIPFSPEDEGTVLDVTTPEQATRDPCPITTRRSQVCKGTAGSKRSLRGLSRRHKATGESMPVDPNSSSSGRDCAGSKHPKTTSVTPRTSISTTESATPKKTRCTTINPRRSNSTKPSAIPEETKSISVSPRRSRLSKQLSTPKKTKITPVNPRRSNANKNIASSKKKNTTRVHPQSSSSTEESPIPKSKKTVGCPIYTETPKRTRSFSSGPGTSGLGKIGSSPEVPTKDGASSRNPKSRTNLQNVGRPKLAEGFSSGKTGESTPAKKPKLVQSPGRKNDLRVVDSKNNAKDKTLAKINNQSNLLNKAKTSQFADNTCSVENVKKCTAKGLWVPPVLPTSNTPSAEGKRPSQSPKTESQSDVLVYPPSVSVYPIPVRAPPVVSPLQPLSIIGWRLLKNQCGECGRVLSSNAALESHVSLHAGRRPFSCKLCGKRFPDSKGLKRHGRVHRNGRIHICQQCGKGFVYSFGLTKHLQVVHGRIKPFVCQVCNHGFFSKRDVEAHIRIHTGEKPFHCNLCDKKFARRTELNMHLRWHNGEKRYWCPFCGKGFLDNNNMKRHKYTHTGEKPHNCPHCPKSFIQSGHLKKHVKNVHKIQ